MGCEHVGGLSGRGCLQIWTCRADWIASSSLLLPLQADAHRFPSLFLCRRVCVHAAEDTVIDKEAVIRLLLQQARPLIEMPCLADPTCVLIDTTR